MSETISSNLTITHSFIFGKVMQEPKICKYFLEKLLGMKIKQINYPEREKEIGILPESHDVRLDIYADDIKAFLRYMGGKKDDNLFVKKVNEKVEEIMLSEKWRIENMSLNAERMDARREGRAEGRAEGLAEGKRIAQQQLLDAEKTIQNLEQKVELLIKKLAFYEGQPIK